MNDSNSNRKQIRSYNDLDVYQNAYEASILVMTQIVPKLPKSEKYDLANQISRSSKAVPRLIAEGFAKQHQKFGFQKYLDDAMAEANETKVGLSQTKDIYSKYIDTELVIKLIDLYDKIGRQLFKLRKVWDEFGKIKTKTENL